MHFKRGFFHLIVGLILVFGGPGYIFASGIHHSPAEICDEHHHENNEGKSETKNTVDMVKIGTQARLRGDFVENQNLGDFSFTPDTRDEQFLSRARLNVSLAPLKWLKGFFQGQYYDRRNHSDYSKANLYQAYLELSDPEHIPIELKIGRQDFCYGSAFFLGANDFYEGLTWDGAKLRILPKDNLWIDLIGTRYVQLNKNTSDDDPALYGAYASYKLTDDNTIDAYLFYHKGGFKFFHTDLPDSDKWYTLGTRFAGNIKQLDYELEPLYQFGRINNAKRQERDTISAFGGHFESGYTFESKYNPRVFFGYAFGSGDNDTSDKKFQEFHGNIYNDNYIVGDTSLIPDLSGLTAGDFRASGMRIFVWGVSADIHPKLNLNLDYHYFTADKTPEGISKRMGSEVNLIATYKLKENVNIIASANRFFTGKFFEDAAGSKKDVNYFYLQTQIEF